MFLKNHHLKTYTQLFLAAFALMAMLDFPLVKAQPVGDISAQRLLDAKSQSGEWFTGGRDHQQSYYSPLADINTANVTQLGFAWSQEIDTVASLEGTPIVVEGMMFASGGSEGPVYAFNAKSGAVRWTFRPHVASEHFRYPQSRGVAVRDRVVYFASGDGFLYALDANKGTVLWKADTIVDRSRTYFITGAPYLAGNVVIVGNGGAEFDARGYVTAYDARTGRQKWRFFTVPADPSKGFEHPELKWAAKSWDPKSSWNVGLGGTAWDGMAYDPKLNLLYVGTGNGVPYPRELRSPSGGDNLFLACILALNPETGRLVWYYQTTPAEAWDYTATQKLILADLKIEGKLRRVILQAPKNGFFYVLDRASGKVISAQPYVYVNWASHIDSITGRPVETGFADYSREPKLVFPGPWGGHNWHPMAYNPGTGLVYIPVLESGAFFGYTSEPFIYRQGKGQSNLGVTWLDGGIPETSLPKEWPSS